MTIVTITTAAVKPELNDAYSYGLVDAFEGEPYAPELLFIKAGDIAAYTEGYLSVRPDCTVAQIISEKHPYNESEAWQVEWEIAQEADRIGRDESTQPYLY